MDLRLRQERYDGKISRKERKEEGDDDDDDDDDEDEDEDSDCTESDSDTDRYVFNYIPLYSVPNTNIPLYSVPNTYIPLYSFIFCPKHTILSIFLSHFLTYLNIPHFYVVHL